MQLNFAKFFWDKKSSPNVQYHKSWKDKTLRWIDDGWCMQQLTENGVLKQNFVDEKEINLGVWAVY